ncbi:hypothetical protein O0I10_007752 [Lichtheimia ornata]|uniref:DinB-like domain-containing protein n=1 Tax=Lichtheimia ornata TaxID=688661 RepID=A0AAD7V0G0_9FUNG|nr:uncharacterized protein O0I10_007752 [Lichtheimia ornata]KAJ8656429.1 hypothetical protein O0I10_007752 [Lichtheimia ornata]
MASTSATLSFEKNAMFIVANKLLQQLIDLLDSLPPSSDDDDQVYTKPSIVMPGGTIGKHSRHIYDHFHLLLLHNPKLGSDPTNNNSRWIVDFDDRSRDRPMEVQHENAVRSLKEMQQKLHQAQEKIPLDTPLLLVATIDDNDKIPKYHMESSFERELWYCCMHAIHHYASIKAICIEHNVPVSKEFGVAPSTTLYHHQHQKMTGHL